jgi:LysM repeat protein
MGKSFNTFIILNITALGLGAAFASDYLVQSGETLSAIAHKVIPGRIYGTNGSVSRVLALNPKLGANPNLIYVGQKIQIPETQTLTDVPATLIRNPASESTSEVQSNPSNSVREKVPTNADEGFGIFSVDVGFASTRISATENSNRSSATLLSKSNSQETFSYSQHWSNNFETSVYFGLDNLSINTPGVGGTIDDSSPTLHHLGITSAWSLSPNLKLGVGLGMDQEPFLTGVSSSVVNLDLLYVPTLKVFSAFDFYENGPFTLGFSGGIGVSASSTSNGYQSKWNPNYDACIYLRQKAFSWMVLETGARANYWDQSTTLSSQAQTDIGVYLKLNFPIGRSFK